MSVEKVHRTPECKRHKTDRRDLWQDPSCVISMRGTDQDGSVSSEYVSSALTVPVADAVTLRLCVRTPSTQQVRALSTQYFVATCPPQS